MGFVQCGLLVIGNMPAAKYVQGNNLVYLTRDRPNGYFFALCNVDEETSKKLDFFRKSR